jgi:glutathione peroxidase
MQLMMLVVTIGLLVACNEAGNNNPANATNNANVNNTAVANNDAANKENNVSNLPPLEQKSVYDFAVKGIDGNEVKMDQFRGKVLLVVNVASQCGYTPQYAGLQTTYDKYKEQGLVVLGFPANDFGAQEPGSDADIKQFCTTKYKVSFPMFSKLTVLGNNKHPLYRFLTEKTTNPQFAGEIDWNFNKFLIGKDGKILNRFVSDDEPDGNKVIVAIEEALKS